MTVLCETSVWVYTCIREVPGSNLSSGTDFLRFSWFSSLYPAHYWDSTSSRLWRLPVHRHQPYYHRQWQRSKIKAMKWTFRTSDIKKAENVCRNYAVLQWRTLDILLSVGVTSWGTSSYQLDNPGSSFWRAVWHRESPQQTPGVLTVCPHKDWLQKVQIPSSHVITFWTVHCLQYVNGCESTQAIGLILCIYCRMNANNEDYGRKQLLFKLRKKADIYLARLRITKKPLSQVSRSCVES